MKMITDFRHRLVRWHLHAALVLVRRAGQLELSIGVRRERTMQDALAQWRTLRN